MLDPPVDAKRRRTATELKWAEAKRIQVDDGDGFLRAPTGAIKIDRSRMIWAHDPACPRDDPTYLVTCTSNGHDPGRGYTPRPITTTVYCIDCGSSGDRSMVPPPSSSYVGNVAFLLSFWALMIVGLVGDHRSMWASFAREKWTEKDTEPYIDIHSYIVPPDHQMYMHYSIVYSSEDMLVLNSYWPATTTISSCWTIMEWNHTIPFCVHAHMC